MRSPRYAPRGEWVDREVDDPGDAAPTAGSVLSMARAFGAEPGSHGIGVLATLSLAPLDDAGLLEVLGLWEMQAAWLAAAQNEALCALRDRAGARAGQVGGPAALVSVAEPLVGPGTAADDCDDREWDREELSLAQGIGGFEAGRRLATAVALRGRLGATSAALAAGRVSWRHADVLARATDGLPPEIASAVERRLLSDRRAVTVAQWRRRAAAAVAALSPATAQEAADSAYEQRSLRAWPGGDGTGQLTGTFTTEGFATVLAAVDTRSARTGPDDHRGADQRRADALVEICAEHLAGGTSTSGAVPPYLVVHLSEEAGIGSVEAGRVGPFASPGSVIGHPLATLGGDALGPGAIRRLRATSRRSASTPTPPPVRSPTWGGPVDSPTPGCEPRSPTGIAGPAPSRVAGTPAHCTHTTSYIGSTAARPTRKASRCYADASATTRGPALP